MDLTKQCGRCTLRFPQNTHFLIMRVKPGSRFYGCPLCYAERMAEANRTSIENIVLHTMSTDDQFEWYRALSNSNGLWKPLTTDQTQWDAWRKAQNNEPLG